MSLQAHVSPGHSVAGGRILHGADTPEVSTDSRSAGVSVVTPLSMDIPVRALGINVPQF